MSHHSPPLRVVRQLVARQSMCFDKPTPRGVRCGDALPSVVAKKAARNRMTDRRSLMKSLAGAVLLGATAANAQRAKAVTLGYLALLPGENRMSFKLHAPP